MKHFFALLLSVLMVLSLLTACGDKTTPSDGDDQTVTDENGSDTDNNTDDTTDPYDAVRSYWSEDQLTQAWGRIRWWSTSFSTRSSPIRSGPSTTAMPVRISATASTTGW